MRNSKHSINRNVTGSAILSLLMANSLLATDREVARLSDDKGGISLEIESPRPLATAVETLIDKYGYSIAYEDPIYSYPEELEDAAPRVFPRVANKSSEKPFALIGPKGGTLSARSLSKAPSDILRQLVEAQTKAGRGGQFRLEQRSGIFQIIPVQSRDRNGNWSIQQSVLDKEISLPTKDRTDQEILRDICDAVSNKARIKVQPVWPIGMRSRIDEFGPIKYNFGANNEVARNVLVRALNTIAADQGNMTWIMLYNAQPSQEGFMLNLVDIPSLTNTQTTIQPVFFSNPTSGGNPFINSEQKRK